jgi:putative YhbY family RNA-binding protein
MLNPRERRDLKARAHKLEPVVIIGGKGLTGEVLAEIERALKAHELVKIRAPGLDREPRARAEQEICARTGSEPVQQIGKVLILYRKNPDA